MKLFKKTAAIIEETRKMQKAEKFRREDRAIVSEFFNGAPPLSDQEAQDLGFTVNVNHLFGYKELADASDQFFGLYTKPATLIEVSLDAAPPGKSTLWGMEASMEASRVLKKIKSFKSAYQGICGDGAMHGEALLFFPNTTFPLPKQCPLSKMLIPDDSSTDPGELSHFAIESPMSIKNLRFYWERSPKGWNKANLGKVLAKIYEGCIDTGYGLNELNIEEAEYRRQENSATASNNRRRPGVDVTYFYQQRPDKFGSPFDLTITIEGEAHSPEAKEGMVLYEGECVVPRIQSCLHPFFMDCILGGAPKWHRVLGLGTLNYQTNHAVELLVNRAQQATMEGSMNIWQAKDVTTREAAEQILMKHNGVLPEGLNLVQNRFQPNFGGIMEMIQFFRQAGSKNSRGTTPNNGDSNDQLEVQAVAEMNSGAAATNNRMTNWYDYGDAMWSEAFARLANPFIDSSEPGYSEVMDFQHAMERRGIPLHYLQAANVSVKAIRIIGDGVRHKELGAVQFLTANRNQYAPEVQPRITRICTGLALDNYRLAEELTPLQEEPDSPQIMRAESENAIMLMSRKPQKPKADDIDEMHVIQHFPALELLISDALQFQNGAFIPQQAEAFRAVGGHIVMHVQRIEGRAMDNRNDPEREKARKFMDQLNQAAAMGEKLVKNMEQAQQGKQEEMDPGEMARLQLDAEKLSLAREKLSHAMQKFDRTQGTREQGMAFEQNLKLERDRRDGQRADSESARGDVDLALKVATAGQRGGSK